MIILSSYKDSCLKYNKFDRIQNKLYKIKTNLNKNIQKFEQDAK